MNRSDPSEVLGCRLREVRERVAAACARAGRSPADVTLVAVTKTVSPATAQRVVDAGVFDLGENRPQELWRKAEALSGDVRWHMIGHLQRNKVARTLPLVTWIHSVDSIRLLQAIDEEAGKLGKNVSVLLEVNTSGEANKKGFAPAAVTTLADTIAGLKYVHVRGLMTMAALQDAEACRPSFAQLRTLRDELRDKLAAPHTFEHLSMGMSNDFDIAIEEGATFIRLGTFLVGGLEDGP